MREPFRFHHRAAGQNACRARLVPRKWPGTPAGGKANRRRGTIGRMRRDKKKRKENERRKRDNARAHGSDRAGTSSVTNGLPSSQRFIFVSSKSRTGWGTARRSLATVVGGSKRPLHGAAPHYREHQQVRLMRLPRNANIWILENLIGARNLPELDKSPKPPSKLACASARPARFHLRIPRVGTTRDLRAPQRCRSELGP